MRKELKSTFRFVSLIAIPLCLVNSLILSFIPSDFMSSYISRFFFSLLITFPQAILYVSLVKKFDNRKKD